MTCITINPFPRFKDRKRTTERTVITIKTQLFLAVDTVWDEIFRGNVWVKFRFKLANTNNPATYACLGALVEHFGQSDERKQGLLLLLI